MSVLFQTKGIVLSRRDHKEVDRWYSVFTKEHGKIDFLARGGHKPLAKLTPHLEAIAEVELLLVNGRYYETVAGVDRTRSFSKIYKDLNRLTLAQNAFHLVHMGTRPYEVDEVLYDVLIQWLNFLESLPEISQERSAYLLGAFTMKLIAIFGYRPELHRCLQCKSGIEQGKYLWHALKGGVVCQKCVRDHEEQYFSARPMADETLKLIRFALIESFEHQLRPHLSGEHLASFHEAIESLIISHFPTIPATSLRTACAV